MAEYYVGMMSGTSLDGVDVALVDFAQGHRVVASHTYPMPVSLRQSLRSLHSGQVHLQIFGELHTALGQYYADCVENFLHQHAIPSSTIRAIGCHGQTVWHSPDGDFPFTLQIGNAQLIATRTGIPTVADFRNKDMVLQGQGAPLVPAFHQNVFFDPCYQTAVLNMGGISNVSLLGEETVIGFDTGPANALLDLWTEKYLGLPYDKNGEFAKQGNILPTLLAECLHDPYFAKRPPKSTGREYFHLDWLWEKCRNAHCENASPADVQRTLVALTVECTVQVLRDWAEKSPLPKRLLLCGGGAKNPLICQTFAHALPHWQIEKTDAFGIGVDDVESCAFAWLAYRRIHRLPSNLPSVTGATRATSLGVIYEP